MTEIDVTIHYGWLDLYSESSNSTWSKLSIKKQWKRRFIVLNHSASNEDEIYLLAFEKEERWRSTQAKKRVLLYPRYKVSKLNDFKGRDKVLQVDNEQDKWYFSADKSKVINLWACQIQMQTKLSRAISGRIFSVVGVTNKDMQSIGAAQQRCLLHFTKWGITLALQDSRAILAMWPIKTIRNYEDSGHSEFTIEAGRKAPMGEGLYQFQTNAGQDRDMFNVIDSFVAAILDEKACITGGRKNVRDDEILLIYDQLHKAATGFDIEQRPRVNDSVDTSGYAHIGQNMISSSTATSINKIAIHKPPDYNHLYGGENTDYNRVQLDEKKQSISSFGSDNSPRGASFSDERNYAKLGGRHQSWGGGSAKGEYDHIHTDTNLSERKLNSTYDQIDRTGSSFKVSCFILSFDKYIAHSRFKDSRKIFVVSLYMLLKFVVFF